MPVLVLNCGSSTVKARLINVQSGAVLARALVDRIGAPDGGDRTLTLTGSPEIRESAQTPDHTSAIDWIGSQLPEGAVPDAIGHRVVHGGEAFVQPTPLTPQVLQELEALSYLAPLHNPAALQGIRAAQRRYPTLPQVAVFDTAFHATLPEHAYRYALPEALLKEHGVRRYGFHGLSHQYVSERAVALCGRSNLRLVSLHLGNGCSVAAIENGKSIDTSMGFTPLEGLVMGTRTGDLDPAIPLFLQSHLGRSAAEVDRLLNKESGLLGLCGDADMRNVESRASQGDPSAALALRLFCYRLRKYVGAYAAAMGGLDALLFTAGIGENSSRVRAEVCQGLEFLGITLDPHANQRHSTEERQITAPDAPCPVLVIPTNEEWIIARETAARITAP